MQGQINNYTTQITTLQSENEVLNGKIDTLNNTIAEKNNQIDELNATITNLHNELEALKQAVDGYTISSVQDSLFLCFANADNTKSYSITSGEQRTGSDLKQMIDLGVESYEVSNQVNLLKDGNVFSAYVNANKYVATSDAEAQPTSITINKIDLSTLEDEANYKVNITLRTSEIYEGTNVVKTAIFDMDIVVIPTLDKLSFVLNADNASYSVEAVDETISGAVVIPDYYEELPVTNISVSAFADCTNLTNITIPEGVTSIGADAFYNCTSLTSITIPEGVTSIEYDLIAGCTNLTSIIIPSSVTNIAERIICNSESLTSVTIKATIPPTLGHIDAFENNATIYVPAESLEAYKTADVWKDIADKIQAIEE